MGDLKVRGFIAISILAGAIWVATPAAANMTINVTYDSSVTSSYTAGQVTTFENAFNAVVSQFQSAITNPVTISIDVSVGQISSTVALPSGDVGGSFVPLVSLGNSSTSFANVKAALAATGATLPSTDPTGGGHFYYMPQAEVRALALTGVYGAPSTFDGYIGFASNFGEFSFSGTPGSTQYAFQAAAEHEIEEVLGRTSSLNDGGLTSGFIADPLDLFRYSSAGSNSFSENAFAYASIDGGRTSLGTFDSTSSGGDRSDWSTPINTTSTDAQNALLTPGVKEGLSTSDEAVLKTLGYTIAANNGGGLFTTANAPVGATPVPEPASLTLLAGSAVMAGWVRRRTRRQIGS